ncbi:hypothetical protein MtrunA17_Chr7g0229491 [Medicago truncatula]|uniref:Uncharacterized protein n=1 Tax=Medicago truncatula TaxID=3880 RepID=A0A396H333_MEDTR|nr:hypothetical protein MtrunA17_Chr7g0229491 [Medicago truncatula]
MNKTSQASRSLLESQTSQSESQASQSLFPLTESLFPLLSSQLELLFYSQLESLNRSSQSKISRSDFCSVRFLLIHVFNL